MIPNGDVPHPDLLPIPTDAAVGKGWTEQMIEMAEYIGPYATLLIVDAFGGQEVYIAQDPRRGPYRDLIGPELATVLSHHYGRSRVRLPTAKTALAIARRQGIVAAARSGQLSVNEAARMLRTSRTYVSHLIHQTSEGLLATPTPQPRLVDPRQMDMFGED